MNIKENNKLIAEFMCLEKEKIFFNLKTGNYVRQETNDCDVEPTYIYIKDGKSVNSLRYNISWDWLIPVICKIQSMNEYVKYIENTSSMVNEGGIYINTKYIENTYEQVVDFINFYNSLIKL
jgi:hypothetical protein